MNALLSWFGMGVSVLGTLVLVGGFGITYKESVYVQMELILFKIFVRDLRSFVRILKYGILQFQSAFALMDTGIIK